MYMKYLSVKNVHKIIFELMVVIRIHFFVDNATKRNRSGVNLIKIVEQVSFILE